MKVLSNGYCLEAVSEEVELPAFCAAVAVVAVVCVGMVF